MRDFLKKLIKAKEERAASLRKQIKESDSADEVRSLGKTLDAVLTELQEAKEKLAELDDDDKGGEGEGGEGGDPNGGEGRGGNPAGEPRGFNPLGSYGQNIRDGAQGAPANEDPHDTVEYRTAFMHFVCRGVPIPMEMRVNEVTATSDAGAVIPTTILNEIISELKSYGNIYSKVRKLNIQGGVEIPILDLKPTASWIGETKSSDDQKIQANTNISFSYYGLECKIAQTLLVNVTTLDMFQNLFVSLATEAIVKGLEVAIIKGTGSGQPTGITVDSRVPSGNVITIKPSEMGSWANWKKKVFAKMKKSYRSGEFLMAQATFDSYIDGMVDTTGQPIGRVNYGIDNGETYRFGGKTVDTVEDDVIVSFDDAKEGDVFGVFVKLDDYAINSNMEMQVVKWIDHDDNKIKNKAILICDGKLVDPNGVLILKKGKDAASSEG